MYFQFYMIHGGTFYRLKICKKKPLMKGHWFVRSKTVAIESFHLQGSFFSSSSQNDCLLVYFVKDLKWA